MGRGGGSPPQQARRSFESSLYPALQEEGSNPCGKWRRQGCASCWVNLCVKSLAWESLPGACPLGAIKCDPSNSRVLQEPPGSSPKMWELIITMQKKTTWKLLSTILLLAEIIPESSSERVRIVSCSWGQHLNHLNPVSALSTPTITPLTCLSRDSANLGS